MLADERFDGSAPAVDGLPDSAVLAARRVSAETAQLRELLAEPDGDTGAERRAITRASAVRVRAQLEGVRAAAEASVAESLRLREEHRRLIEENRQLRRERDELRRDRDTLNAQLDEHAERLHHLSIALSTRDVIGQAKGILMERCHLDDAGAWNLLVALSQRSNLKVRDLAAMLAGTGRAPGLPPRGPGRAAAPPLA